MKKILITGGAGFIGSHCVDLFLAEGHSVGVFDIKTKKEAVNVAHVHDAITYIEGDVRDFSHVAEVTQGYDLVLHLAAIVSVPESIKDPVGTHETNVTGTLNVFESARQAGVSRVVYASSAAVYGDTQSVPTSEDVAVAPLSPYGLHKVMNESYAELYTQQYGVSGIGLRFFNVYGSRQDPSSPYSGVISIFNNAMKDAVAPTVYGDGSATRDFIHVSDVAQVCLKALCTEDIDCMVCNVGTGNAVSIETLIKTLNVVLGVNLEPVYTDARTGDIVHSCAIIEKAQTHFSVPKIKSLEEGLRELKEFS